MLLFQGESILTPFRLQRREAQLKRKFPSLQSLKAHFVYCVATTTSCSQFQLKQLKSLLQ